MWGPLILPKAEADAEADDAGAVPAPVLRRPAAAAAAKRPRLKIPPPPPGLGCSMCRRAATGCSESGRKAKVALAVLPDGTYQRQDEHGWPVDTVVA